MYSVQYSMFTVCSLIASLAMLNVESLIIDLKFTFGVISGYYLVRFYTRQLGHKCKVFYRSFNNLKVVVLPSSFKILRSGELLCIGRFCKDGALL